VETNAERERKSILPFLLVHILDMSRISAAVRIGMTFHISMKSFVIVAAVTLFPTLLVKQTTGLATRRVSVPYDWSHQHVVYSRPASLSQAWKLQQEPRYWQQIMRRNAARRSGNNLPELAGTQDGESDRLHKKSPIHRDWAESLGSGASTGNSTYSQFPAKFTFDISPTSESCADYAVFTTNVPGVTGTSEATPGQASVIAFQNLYAGTNGACGAAPTVAWAYNTNVAGDTTGVVNGSPSLSLDGTKVAFVESKPGGSALHLLQYTLGDGTDANGVSVAAPPTNLLSSGGWNSCPTDGSSCMISLTFTPATVSSSSPFYHFATDELYVGDDNGVLHKFTGVFNGTPTEVTSGWPIAVNPGAILNPPVFDTATNNAYVTDSSGLLSYIRDVASNSGSCAAGNPPCLGATSLSVGGGHPIVDAPLLDPSTGKVFAFVGNNGGGHAVVVQANTDLTGVVTQLVGAAGAPLHLGAFDNTYLNSSAGSISGFLYVCGKGAADFPTLRQIGFDSSGTMSNVSLRVLQVGNIAGTGGQCSPLTEIFNSGTDFMFFSVQSGGRSNAGFNCGGQGCVMSAVVTGGFPSGVAASLPEAGGTSGIIIDNVGTFGQDSSLYFSRLGQSTLTSCGGSGSSLVGCAIKLTQSGLN